jgi:hypothetical protein
LIFFDFTWIDTIIGHGSVLLCDASDRLGVMPYIQEKAACKKAAIPAHQNPLGRRFIARENLGICASQPFISEIEPDTV